MERDVEQLQLSTAVTPPRSMPNYPSTSLELSEDYPAITNKVKKLKSRGQRNSLRGTMNRPIETSSSNNAPPSPPFAAKCVKTLSFYPSVSNSANLQTYEEKAYDDGNDLEEIELEDEDINLEKEVKSDKTRISRIDAMGQGTERKNRRRFASSPEDKKCPTGYLPLQVPTAWGTGLPSAKVL